MSKFYKIMNITPINYNYTPYFKSRVINSPLHDNWIDNSTIFSSEIDWDNLLEIIENEFKNDDKINVYDFACLDGSDVYTLVMMLDKTKNNNKFYPIYASDLNKREIKRASHGKIELTTRDFSKIEEHKIDYTDYFHKGFYGTRHLIDSETGLHKEIYRKMLVKDTLREKVNFENGDITTSIDKIEKDKKSIVILKNIFCYFNERTKNKILKNISRNLKEGSLLILGNTETAENKINGPISDITGTLLKLGFYPHENSTNQNVWIYKK